MKIKEFIGIAVCNWPGTWGWTAGDYINERIFWIGPIGFGFKIHWPINDG